MMVLIINRNMFHQFQNILMEARFFSTLPASSQVKFADFDLIIAMNFFEFRRVLLK